MKAFKDLNPGDIIYYYDHCKMKPLEVVTCKIEETENRVNTWRGYEVLKDKDLIITTKTGKPIKIYWTHHNADITNVYRNHLQIFSCKEAAENELNRLKNYRKYKIEAAQRRVNKYTAIMNKYEIL